MTDMRCPCGQGNYASCCQPLHAGQSKAQSAAQLMRSRYSAFAKHEIEYIVQTTAVGQQQALDVPAIAAWSNSNLWLKLDVVQANEKLDKTHAQVEFKAHYQAIGEDGQTPQVHHEVSHFVKHNEAWFFLDPTTDQQMTMKQPCICGSGKKFKQCCAQYL
ncbi:YchJ family protein [Acinetobacter sp. ANC 3813]|uniref:YchJ family protein n=1 Tax=Acinetobacter sp. ANC 3813 TaxID=1977873 RepID=UPI000A337382|nr:YchJ family protein [Acinetobacter sp. ANC 3813]OTG86292.1 SEC-C motif-containing protein [Acinetobacter sp. ANC 3813]